MTRFALPLLILAAVSMFCSGALRAQEERLELPAGSYFEELRAEVRKQRGGAPEALAKSVCRTLAKQLLDEVGGDEAIDAINRYVLLELARDCAVKAGDVALSMRVADELATLFRVDRRANEIDTLCSAIREADPKDRDGHLPRLLEAIHGAIRERQLELAGRGLAVFDGLGSKRQLGPVLEVVTTLKNDLTWLQNLVTERRAALAALADAGEMAAKDADLEAAGIGLCILDDQWQEATALLIRARSQQWRQAAESEQQALNADGDGQRGLRAKDACERWLDLAESHANRSHTAAGSLLRHARQWLSHVSAALRGSLQKRADRLECELDAALRCSGQSTGEASSPRAERRPARGRELKLAEWFPVGATFAMTRTRSNGETHSTNGTVTSNDGHRMEVQAPALGGGSPRLWIFEIDGSGKLRLIGVPKAQPGRGGEMRNYHSDLKVTSTELQGDYSWDLLQPASRRSA